jgi:hypothetical protein
MDFTFHVTSRRDAKLAQVAIDAMLDYWYATDSECPRPQREDDLAGLPKEANEYPSTGFTSVGPFTIQMPGNAEINPLPECEDFIPHSNHTVTEEVGNDTSEVAYTGAIDGPAPLTKEQIKAAAALSPELAALVSKRGRKSAAEQFKIDALTRLALGLDPTRGVRPKPIDEFEAGIVESIGKALEGATAEELAAALAQTTTVTETAPGVEVRTLVATGNPAVEVAEVISNGSAGSTGATVDPDFDFLAKNEELTTQAEAEPIDLDRIGKDDLMDLINAYAGDGAGILWYRCVVEKGGGKTAKLTPDYLRGVLRNPEAYYPEA